MKEFIDYTTIRNDALKMAHRINQDGFVPDIIYASLRGGAYLANTLSEYFKLARTDSHPVLFAAVVARSYADMHQQDRVMIDGWTYSPEYLRHGDKILLVDDLFDTGRTVNYLVDVLMNQGIPREDIKVAVHEYKYFSEEKDPLPIQPDYWCNKTVQSSRDADRWIHYLSHELIGLTEDEREKYYYSQDPELRDVLEPLYKGK